MLRIGGDHARVCGEAAFPPRGRENHPLDDLLRSVAKAPRRRAARRVRNTGCSQLEARVGNATSSLLSARMFPRGDPVTLL
jgi:hypothetical protein